jgi:hypothetical protein
VSDVVRHGLSLANCIAVGATGATRGFLANVYPLIATFFTRWRGAGRAVHDGARTRAFLIKEPAIIWATISSSGAPYAQLLLLSLTYRRNDQVSEALPAHVAQVEFPLVDFARLARGFEAQGAVVTRLEHLSAVERWIKAGAQGVFVLDLRITRSVVADWLAEVLSGEQG